jgi:hypothetical protein
MEFCGKRPVRSKLILDNQLVEQVSKFNYLGCRLSYQGEADVSHKLEKLNFMWSTIKWTLKNKTRIETQCKFYKVMAISAYVDVTW